MFKGRYRRTNIQNGIKVLALFVALIAMQRASQCSEFTALSYPLPLETDGTSVPSSLYLQVETKDYGVPLEKLASQSSDARELLLVKALQAIRAKDAATLSQFWGLPREVKGGQAKEPEANGPDAPRLIAIFHAIYGDMAQITVVNQALMGAKSVFVVELGSAAGPRRMGFEVGSVSGGKSYIQSVTSTATPIANLFVAAMSAALKEPARYKPQANLALKFRYAFPLEGKGSSGSHPAVLQFAGEALNFKLVDGPEATSNPVLTFYRQAYTALKKHDTNTFIALFTPGSEKDLKKWVAGMNEAAMAKFYTEYGQDKYVKFVLNADPVYIIFYSPDPSDQWEPDSLQYEYVFKNASGEYRLTNFTYQGYLDDILRNPALFNPQILRRAKAPDVRPAV
jgi:hypothetical protein